MTASTASRRGVSDARCGFMCAAQNEPQIQELFNSCAHDHARLEALASESSKKRTREAPKDAKT